jgi:hypothetical protein
VTQNQQQRVISRHQYPQHRAFMKCSRLKAQENFEATQLLASRKKTGEMKANLILIEVHSLN